MGRASRVKGKVGEREVARAFRSLPCLEGCAVRRSQQGRGAEEPDVLVPGLWVESQFADVTTPERKLAQAERDSRDHERRIPVAITRRTRARETYVTLRLCALMHLATPFGTDMRQTAMNPPVTLTLDRFLAIYAQAVADGHIDVGAEQEGAA